MRCESSAPAVTCPARSCSFGHLQHAADGRPSRGWPCGRRRGPAGHRQTGLHIANLVGVQRDPDARTRGRGGGPGPSHGGAEGASWSREQAWTGRSSWLMSWRRAGSETRPGRPDGRYDGPCNEPRPRPSRAHDGQSAVGNPLPGLGPLPPRCADHPRHEPDLGRGAQPVLDRHQPVPRLPRAVHGHHRAGVDDRVRSAVSRSAIPLPVPASTELGGVRHRAGAAASTVALVGLLAARRCR